MAQITVTPEEIRTVAGQVMAGATEIEAQRKQVLAKIQQLGETWQGVAAGALQSLYERWDTQAQSLNQTLTEISQAMERAATNYEETEQAVAKTFQQ